MFPVSPHDFVNSRSPEPSHGSNDGEPARGSQADGDGSIAPVSMTSANFSLPMLQAGWRPSPLGTPRYGRSHYYPVELAGTRKTYYILGANDPSWVRGSDAHVIYERDPLTLGYVPTDLTARHGSRGWVLNNPPPAPTTSARAQPGSPGASSSQPMTPAMVRRRVAAMMRDPFILELRSGIKFKDHPPIHTFHDEKFSTGAPDGAHFMGYERDFVMETVEAYFRNMGYLVERQSGAQRTRYLKVTSPETTQPFSVYVKLSTHGETVPPTYAPMGEPYLIAGVNIDPRDGALKTLHLIPIKHRTGMAAWTTQ